MIGGADEHKRFGRERDAEHFVGVARRREFRAVADDEVEAAVDERFQQLLRRTAGDDDAHARVRPGEARDRVGEQGLQRIGAAADRDGAAAWLASNPALPVRGSPRRR